MTPSRLPRHRCPGTWQQAGTIWGDVALSPAARRIRLLGPPRHRFPMSSCHELAHARRWVWDVFVCERGLLLTHEPGTTWTDDTAPVSPPQHVLAKLDVRLARTLRPKGAAITSRGDRSEESRRAYAPIRARSSASTFSFPKQRSSTAAPAALMVDALDPTRSTRPYEWRPDRSRRHPDRKTAVGRNPEGYGPQPWIYVPAIRRRPYRGSTRTPSRRLRSGRAVRRPSRATNRPPDQVRSGTARLPATAATRSVARRNRTRPPAR